MPAPTLAPLRPHTTSTAGSGALGAGRRPCPSGGPVDVASVSEAEGTMGDVDSSPRHVHACLLRLATLDELPLARALVRQAVAAEFGGWPDAGSPRHGALTVGDRTLRWDDWVGARDDQVRELVVDTPGPDRTLRHRLHVQVGADDGAGFVFARRSILSAHPALSGPVSYDPAPHPLVGAVLDAVHVVDAGRRVRTDAQPISAANLTDLLDAPDRHLPVVVLLPDTELIGARIAATLAGLAHTVTVSASAAAQVRDAGRWLPADGGAVLWAGPHRRATTFPAAKLHPSPDGVPAWALARSVFAASAFRVHAPDAKARLRARATRQRHEDNAAAAEAAGNVDELLTQWEQDLSNLDAAHDEIAVLRGELEQLRGDFDGLLASFDAKVAEAAAARSSRPALAAAPTSMGQVAARADVELAHVEFTDRARAGAAASTFVRPEEVWADLVELDALAALWAQGSLPPGGVHVAALAAGLPWRRGISKTARTHYGDDYVAVRDDGTVVELAPHLAYGANVPPDRLCRIYLHLDTDRHRFVVGHVGGHLRDASCR